MTPHWIYETDEAGNRHRCYFDGEDWHVLIECPDGNRAASSAPFRTDAVTKARMKLGLPVMATILPAPVEWSADEAALQPAQIAAMAGGPRAATTPSSTPWRSCTARCANAMQHCGRWSGGWYRRGRASHGDAWSRSLS